MRVKVTSVGIPWKPPQDQNADPLWTINIEGIGEPCKTYDPELAKVGEHEAETFTSKSGKEYWRTSKSAQKPATQGYKGKDEDAIKAMWAIGQAVQLELVTPKINPNGGPEASNIEVWADKLFAMVDRVKQGTPDVSKVDRGDFASADLPPVELYDEG
jgi:hypothetical protein